ncbi:hypothetical protein chiPu_0021472 [Chiloscyllium punctatum]|uniref:Uncharacterized protein n=1 Tax=Chiloscyllium punctatum TaxID=137246 RepID=A0A401RFS4_CHIPU|nr:hypothetical protein [Chiloscyllium punctatum]
MFWRLSPVWCGDWARCGLDIVPSVVCRLGLVQSRVWPRMGSGMVWKQHTVLFEESVSCGLETWPSVAGRLGLRAVWAVGLVRFGA